MFPDSNSAKALSDSRSAGEPLKYLEHLEYICSFLTYEPSGSEDPHDQALEDNGPLASPIPHGLFLDKADLE